MNNSKKCANKVKVIALCALTQDHVQKTNIDSDFCIDILMIERLYTLYPQCRWLDEGRMFTSMNSIMK